MRGAFFLWLACLFLPVFFNAAEARQITDHTGTKVNLADSPARIVTLAPNIAEIAAAVLGNHLDKIVGVSEYTDFPESLSRVKSIGPYARFNLELVVALKPDLVLANWNGNSKDQIEHLRELGLSVVTVKTDRLSDVAAAIQLVADALGKHSEGAKISESFEKSLAAVSSSASHSNAGPTRVLLQLDSEPLVVAGQGSFLSEALEKVGAVNVYADSSTSYPRPSFEDAVARNPDVIIFLGMKSADNPGPKLLRQWQRFPDLKAVKDHKVLVLLNDEIVRPSPRVVLGLSALKKAIYGE